MKLITFLIFFATFCKLNFSHSIPTDFASFQNYRNVLAFILNQTKTIDGLILDGVENLVGYADEPDDYLQTIGDYLIKSLYKEPQVPYFDEFGAEFHQLSCQEIEEELNILFDVSKYFVMKAVRNEETIKMLKNLISDMAKIGYNNYDLISNVIDTIADNYAAQNHVFMMIEDLDDEIKEDIETIAKYCRNWDYKAIEEPVEGADDGLLDILMDNGQDLLELIGIKAAEGLEVEEPPELLVFKENVDPEGLEKEAEPVETQEYAAFEEFEEPEDPNFNKTIDNLPPIVINLVIEPESPKTDDKQHENQPRNAATEEILDFLAENPEVVELLLEEIKPEKENEVVDQVEFLENAEDDKKVIKAENLEFKNFEDEVQLNDFMMKSQLETEDSAENSESKDLNSKDFKLEDSERKNINEKGIIVKVPYPDEEVDSINDKEADDAAMGPKNVENPGVVPENFKIIFPIRNEKLEPIDDINDENFEKDLEDDDLMMMEPEIGENLVLENQKIEKKSDLVETENDEDIKFIKDSDLKFDEGFKLQKELNLKENDQIDDKFAEKNYQTAENDKIYSEYSDEDLSTQPHNEDKQDDSKEFVDFKADDLYEESEDFQEKDSNFENFLKIPENFWEVPFGFWQSFQNFMQRMTSSSSKKFDEAIDTDETDTYEHLNQNSRITKNDNLEELSNIKTNSTILLKIDENGSANEDLELTVDLNDSNKVNLNEEFPEDENLVLSDKTADEAIKSEIFNDEELTRNGEIFNQKIDQEEQDTNDEQFGIDDEIESEIKKNQEKSIKDSTFDKTGDLKDVEFEEIFDNRIQQDHEDSEELMPIDNQIDENEVDEIDKEFIDEEFEGEDIDDEILTEEEINQIVNKKPEINFKRFDDAELDLNNNPKIRKSIAKSKDNEEENESQIDKIEERMKKTKEQQIQEFKELMEANEIKKNQTSYEY